MARNPVTPQIDAGRCTGCGRCIAACHLPLFAFETQAWRKFAVVQLGPNCTGCGKCETRCPVGAIGLLALEPLAPLEPHLHAPSAWV